MLKLSIDETGVMVEDYRGAPVARIPMVVDKSTAITVNKYRKSKKVTIQGMEFWNVVSCTWMGKTDHPDIEESESTGLKLF